MSIREDLKAFVDNELPAERAEEVRLAIEEDPALQQEVTFMKLLSREIQESAAEPEIEGAPEAIEVVRKKPGIFRRYRTAWAVGGLVLVVLLALPYLNRQADVAMNESAVTSSPVAMGLEEANPVKPTQTGAAAASPKVEASNSVAMKRRLEGTDFVGTTIPGRSASPVANAKAESTTTEQAPPNPNSDSNEVQAPTTAAPVPAPQILTPESSRKIIQNGDLRVTVDDVQSAQIKATNLTIASGGFVQNSSLDYESQITPTVSLTLRIPAARFAAVTATIMGYGKVTSSHVTGEDVSAQYADVNARLQELGAEEDSYVGMLRTTHRLSEVMQLKDKLSEVRQDIASLHAQSAALKDQSTLSTLNLTFDQKSRSAKQVENVEPKDPWAKNTFKSALDGLTTAGRFLGQVIIFLFVYSPLWIPLAGLVWWLNRRKK